MNIKQLSEKKLVKIQRKVNIANDAEGKPVEQPFLVMEQKRFDPQTGKEIDPVVQNINPVGLQSQKEQMEKQRDELNEKIEGIDYLLEKLEK